MAKNDPGLSRRELMRLSAAGVLATSTSGWFDSLARAATIAQGTPGGAVGAPSVAATSGKHAKACILLWMNGGPSQSHTFDVKPGGEYASIATDVPGMRISEYLPRMARQMKHCAILRSMSTGEAVHPRARFLMHNGYRPSGGQSYPAMGCVASAELGREDFELPTFVAIDGGVDGNNAGRPYRSVPAYLGPRHAPLLVGDPAKGVENLKPTVAAGAFDERFDLLADAEKRFAEKYDSDAARAHDMAYQQALRLMRSDKAKAFELGRESAAVRAGYGDSQFGRGCLLARRLVEVGVPFVEVTLGGWDDHGGAGRNVKRRSPVMDAAMATLLADLQAKGMLDSTLVVWMGEFGRNPGSGSQHFARAWTTVLAGGGLKTGQVVGKTDPTGREVTDRPISARDYMATVYAALGIDYKKEYTTAGGRPIRIADKGAKVVEQVLG
jgi:uncharacterized protein (DUF1501 family)